MTAAGKRRTSMSEWRDEINRKALARLDKALPDVFPAAVLTHAMGRRFTPPMPRLATHPVRADRLARALSAKSGGPAGWTWRLGDEKPDRVRRRGRKAPAEPGSSPPANPVLHRPLLIRKNRVEGHDSMAASD
jgi:hypothetical protein